MVKVLYVAAWGRSGTTLVDNILGGHEGVFSAGELHYLWRRGLVHRRRCGCGEPVSDCPLWNRILTAAFGDTWPDPTEIASLQRRVVRVRHTMTLLKGQWSSDVSEYAAIMARLYGAIREVTGAELIVDSSKLPPEAAILARMSGLDPYLLHMVRDPRAVAHSWSRPTDHRDRAEPVLMARHTPTRSTANWLLWNGLIESVGRVYGDRHRRLRYEDLVTDPRARIASLLDFTGVPATASPFTGSHSVNLRTNHTVSGNPGRFRTGDLAVRPDNAWRRHLRPAARLTATVIALPLLPWYRYPPWPRRPGSS